MHILYSIYGVRQGILVLEKLLFNIFNYKKLGNIVTVLGFPIIRKATTSKINVGKNLKLVSNSYFSPPGVNHPVIIRTVNSKAEIRIGNDVGISGGAITAAYRILIGDNVMLGSNVVITDTDFHPIAPENRRYRTDDVKTAEVIIEDNVFIGMNSMILKGVHIGKNSVIGAGSVVTKDIPENCIAVGNPAEVIRELVL